MAEQETMPNILRLALVWLGALVFAGCWLRSLSRFTIVTKPNEAMMSSLTACSYPEIYWLFRPRSNKDTIENSYKCRMKHQKCASQAWRCCIKTESPPRATPCSHRDGRLVSILFESHAEITSLGMLLQIALSTSNNVDSLSLLCTDGEFSYVGGIAKNDEKLRGQDREGGDKEHKMSSFH